MRWNWLRDKETHQQLHIFWDKGTNNSADYFIKHHPPSHHLTMRPQYVLNAHKISKALNLTDHTTVRPFRIPGARVCSSPNRYTTVRDCEHLDNVRPTTGIAHSPFKRH
jgi:hypothetical protein